MDHRIKAGEGQQMGGQKPRKSTSSRPEPNAVALGMDREVIENIEHRKKTLGLDPSPFTCEPSLVVHGAQVLGLAIPLSECLQHPGLEKGEELRFRPEHSLGVLRKPARSKVGSHVLQFRCR